jgi:hypothetical protein
LQHNKRDSSGITGLGNSTATHYMQHICKSGTFFGILPLFFLPEVYFDADSFRNSYKLAAITGLKMSLNHESQIN